ncbi:uncharacterized protein [Nicotiana sylvestris]|uniref:uncharacterized protein n=1 Tax=Nicotiana sylvestris TaxID=4096 RepID=UPI00388C6C25
MDEDEVENDEEEVEKDEEEAEKDEEEERDEEMAGSTIAMETALGPIRQEAGSAAPSAQESREFALEMASLLRGEHLEMARRYFVSAAEKVGGSRVPQRRRQPYQNCLRELRAQAQARAFEEMNASAKVPALEVQLRLTQDNAKVQADMIGRLESDLSEVIAEIIDAGMEAALNRAKADRKMAICVKDATNAQAELKQTLDREWRIEEYVRCKSRREVFEEIDARGFVLSEELARARADERNAQSLLIDATEGDFGKLLRKSLNEERSLRLLCDEKEVELVHLRCEASRSLNYENYLKEQKQTKALKSLRDRADRAEHDELKARVEAQASEGKGALAKVPAFEAQLRMARDNASVQVDIIKKLESELSKFRVEIDDARAEVVVSQTKADQEMAIYLKDVTDAQAELRRILDHEERIGEYAHCKSHRKTLEEICARGFVLSEELARVRANERDARLLLSDSEESKDEAGGP